MKVANPSLGETIAVVGCGMMGLLTIAGLKYSSASKIIAIDVQDSRLELARKFGATHTINPLSEDVAESI
ncbi:zinc-binding dehydrogenase, partial [Escherichia coli]|nr:zinc-binding dehydrogenase [Escherichia coli]